MRASSFARVFIRLASVGALFLAVTANAAQWAQTFGGSGVDAASSAQPTADGGYIVGGHRSASDGLGLAAWLMKLDAVGNLVWQKTYERIPGDYIVTSVQPTPDGGYVVAGNTSPRGAENRDVWVAKLDANGGVVWQRSYGGANADWANAVQPTADGGYIVVGLTYSFNLMLPSGKLWVLKLDAGGNVSWQRIVGAANGSGEAHAVRPTVDGGFIVAGNTTAFGAGGSDAWLLRLNANGDVVWQRTYGGTNSDFFYAVQATAEGGFIAAGSTYSFGAGEGNAWVVKLDAVGNVIWQKMYGYGGTSHESINSLSSAPDGGYIVAGLTWRGSTSGWDAWALKLDAGGSVVWQKAYGGSEDDGANSVQPTLDGGYFVAGNTNSFGARGRNAWALKLDADGDIANCAGSAITNAPSSDTSANVASSAALVASTDAIPTTNAILVREPAISVQRICYYAALPATGIPALTGWNVILLSGLAGLLGAATLRRIREDAAEGPVPRRAKTR
jgi:hypothetical protein